MKDLLVSKKQIKRIALVTTILFLVGFIQIPQSQAWGPCTHVYITEQSLDLADQNQMTQLIKNNKAWFLCGLMMPDVTVIYYYTEFKSYRATHSFVNFYDELWASAVARGSDQGKAFAIGVGLHLVQDSIVHNIYIPDKIRTTLVPNNIIHPVVEGIIEAHLIANYPVLKAMAESSFDPWDDPFTDSQMNNLTPIAWMNQILRLIDDPVTPEDETFVDEATIFHTILSGGGFGLSFMGWSFGQQEGFLWDIFRGVSSVAQHLIPFEDAEPYLNRTIEATVDWFNDGDGANAGSFAIGDPTGIEALSSADSYVFTVTAVITIVFLMIVTYIILRKRQQKPVMSIPKLYGE